MANRMAGKHFEVQLYSAITQAKNEGAGLDPALERAPGQCGGMRESTGKEAPGSRGRGRPCKTLERGKPMGVMVRDGGTGCRTNGDVAGGSNPLKRPAPGREGTALVAKRMRWVEIAGIGPRIAGASRSVDPSGARCASRRAGSRAGVAARPGGSGGGSAGGREPQEGKASRKAVSLLGDGKLRRENVKSAAAALSGSPSGSAGRKASRTSNVRDAMEPGLGARRRLAGQIPRGIGHRALRGAGKC